MEIFNRTAPNYMPKIGVVLFVFAIFYTFKLSFFLDVNDYLISGILSFGLMLFYITNQSFFCLDKNSCKVVALFFIGTILGTRGNLNAYIGITLLIIPFFFLVFLKKRYKEIILRTFDKVFSIILLISLLAWCLHLIKVPLPHFSFQWKSYFFDNYYLFIRIADVISFYAFPRFQFIFTEPGYFACLCVFMIYLRGYNFKQWQTIVYLIALILTFSLSGYILFFLGLIPFFITKKQGKSKYIVIFSILIIAFFFLVMQEQDNVFSSMFAYRLKFENGTMSGYNRTTGGFEHWWTSYFLQDGNIWWGNNEIIERKFAGEDMIGVDLRVYIARFGIIPLIFYFGSMFTYYRANKTHLGFFFFILFAIFYYRGYTVMYYMGFPMLYIMGIQLLNKQKTI